DSDYLSVGEDVAIQQSEPLVNASAEHLKIEANIKAFAQRVRVMAPKVSEVAVHSDYSSDYIGPDTNFGMLTTHLYKLVNRVEYNLVSNLVHIKYIYNSAPDQLLHLARLNALTLLSLTIDTDVDYGRTESGFDFCGLIQGEDSSYTTYPRLTKLKVCAPLDEFITSQSILAVDSTVLPFPSLQSLHFGMDYPFNDDTLSRGNAATLERLAIDLDIQTVEISCRHRIIGPGASVREVYGATCIENSETTLTCLGYHANIKTLTLGCIRLDLWNIIALVKSLPFLSYLHYSLKKLGKTPTGITRAGLPAFCRLAAAALVAVVLVAILVVVASLRPWPLSVPLALLQGHKDTAKALDGGTTAKSDKVLVELFVMSRCPDAIKVEEVFSSVVPSVHSIMDIQLNFIAALNPNATFGAECKHGDAECRGNIDELCALRHRPDLPSFWRFLMCLNSHYEDIGRDDDLSLKCASSSGLDTAAFLACSLQNEGRSLFKQSAENAQFARVSTSATVFINGKPRCVEDGEWYDCPGGHSPDDFIRDICAAYKGSVPRPSICAQYKPTVVVDGAF
ncbi:hypothetical protein GGI20_003283, partial [Coemansia sp. BCRC 34301]